MEYSEALKKITDLLADKPGICVKKEELKIGGIYLLLPIERYTLFGVWTGEFFIVSMRGVTVINKKVFYYTDTVCTDENRMAESINEAIKWCSDIQYKSYIINPKEPVDGWDYYQGTAKPISLDSMIPPEMENGFNRDSDNNLLIRGTSPQFQWWVGELLSKYEESLTGHEKLFRQFAKNLNQDELDELYFTWLMTKK